jgi:surfactin synthase thioesterase subunit
MFSRRPFRPCAYNIIIGMGESDKPIMRYSTSEMAKDVLEILEHIGWTSERQLHILGVSMGGMIAQELVGITSTSIHYSNEQFQHVCRYEANPTLRHLSFPPASAPST